MLKINAIIILLAFVIVTIGLHIFYSNITTYSEDVKLTLRSHFSLDLKFYNGSELTIGREGVYLLSDSFNVSRVYVSAWLEPDRRLPVTFLCIPKQYVVPHLIFQNGSEVVLNNFIIHPWGDGFLFTSMVIGGIDEREVYEVRNSINALDFYSYDPYWRYDLYGYHKIRYASMDNLTCLLQDLIIRHNTFSITFHAPSTYTILNYPREIPIVFDKQVAKLTFTGTNGSILLSVIMPEEEVLGTYRLTYNARSLGWYNTLKNADFALTVLTIAFIAVFVIVYLFKRTGPKKALLILGLVLLALGAYVNYNSEDTYKGYVLLHFYSYFTDNRTVVPAEVMWHVSKAFAGGAKPASDLPKAINWEVFIGYELFELPLEANLLVGQIGLGSAVFVVDISSESGETYCYDYYARDSLLVYPGGLKSSSGERFITLPELSDGEKAVVNANAKVYFFLNRECFKGNAFIEGFNLCRFDMKYEKGYVLLENFTLPNTYVLPEMNVEYVKKIGWVNPFLELIGFFFIILSLILWFSEKDKSVFKQWIKSFKKF